MSFKILENSIIFCYCAKASKISSIDVASSPVFTFLSISRLFESYHRTQSCSLVENSISRVCAVFPPVVTPTVAYPVATLSASSRLTCGGSCLVCNATLKRSAQTTSKTSPNSVQQPLQLIILVIT